MSIEDPRLTSIDNTSAADDFDSAVEQHLGFVSEAVDGIEVAQAETPDAGRTDRLPAQTPVQTAAAVLPSEVTPNAENVVRLPAGIELDNLEFAVEGGNLVLLLADGTEIIVVGGAANIPTFVIGDVELPQVALFAALEGSNINVAAGPDGTFSAQGGPTASRNFNDDPIDAGPEDLALADLLGDTAFGDDLLNGTILGGAGAPTIDLGTELTDAFIIDEAVIADGIAGNQTITGTLPFNPGPDFGTISRINFTGASNVDEGDGSTVLAGFTSGGRPITVTSNPAPADGTIKVFEAITAVDSEGNPVFTLTVNRETGEFTFELIGKLEHPDAGANGAQDDLDDLLRLGFTYTVTDLDGDSVTGTFNIDVMDDAPTIGTPEGDTVYEDDLTGGFDGPVPVLLKVVSDAKPDGGSDEKPLFKVPTAEGSLAIRWGADDDLKSDVMGEDGEPTGSDAVGRTVAFTGLDTSSTSEEIEAAIPGLANLSSDGAPLSYRIEYTRDDAGNWNGGYQLIAYKSYGEGPYYADKSLFADPSFDGPIYLGPGYERGAVFIITLDPTTANGSYTFELIGNLDHYAPDTTVPDVIVSPDPDLPGDVQTAAFVKIESPSIDGKPVDFLDLKIPFTATDSDGDSVDGSVTVRVEDDEPVVVGDAIELTVDEDDIQTGNSTGTSPNDGNGDGSYTGDSWSNGSGPATVSGYLGGLVDFGADNANTHFSIIDEAAARAELTKLGLSSKGGLLSFDVIGNTLYAFVNKDAPGVEYNAGQDRLVFSLTVENWGAYKFELHDQLDHDKPAFGRDQNTDLQDGIVGKDVTAIDFGSIIEATDFDGDSVSLTGKLSVTIVDDVPELVKGATEYRTVDEDDIRNSQSTGTSPNDSNGDGSFTGSPNNNQPGPAFISGSLTGLVKGGADDTIKFEFIDEAALRQTLSGLNLSSKGETLSFDLQGNVLWGFANVGGPSGVSYDPENQDRPVFKLTLNQNGSYTFELIDQLDHDTGAGENTGLLGSIANAINFGSVIKVTDFDGDSITLGKAFSIEIRDDVPVLSGTKKNRTVDEDDILNNQSTGTSPADGQSDGSWTGGPGQNGQGGAFIDGSLASLVKGGADETVKFTFIDETALRQAMTPLNLSSKGEALSFDLQGNVLWGFANVGAPGVSYDPNLGDRPVFKLTLNENGTYTFELLDQLDHDAGAGQNTGLLGSTADAIDFGSVIKVTDYDGDSVVLKGAFSVTIADDVPVLSGKSEDRLVDEDDIKTSQSTGTSPADGQSDGSWTGGPGQNGNGGAFIDGSLAGLIKGGADDTVKFSFIAENDARDALEKLGLKSQGQELSYDIRDGVLYAFDNAGSQQGESYDNGDRLVFKLALGENGSYTFELVDQLDHDDAKGQNTDLEDDVYGDVEAIDFGSIIKATDFDGDSVVLKDAFSITIKDDVPVLSGTKEDRIIDEDDIATIGNTLPGESLGTSPNDGDADDSFTQSPRNNQAGPAYISGSLANLVKGGADDPITFAFISETAIRSMLSGLGLSSKGATLSFDLKSDGTLYAFDNAGPHTDDNYNSGADRLVFSLKLNGDGTYEFRLFDQLDHDAPFDDRGDGQGIADENFDLQDDAHNADVTAINFGKLITATDYDGDSVSLDGAFSIKVRDDIPEAVARNTDATLVVDETAGQQNDDLGYSLSVFNGVANKGTDPNMAAQFAQQANFVAADIDGGADDDVKVDWALKLNGNNGLNSGLMTTDGRSIMLFLEGDLIVGRYDSPSDGNTAVNSSDPAAFALHISDNGTLSLAQYVSIKHDDPADHDETNDAADGNLSTALQTLAGKINAVLTVTDFDGDKAVSEIAVGDRIQFEDDGPSVNPYEVNTMRIISDDDTVVGKNGNPGFGSNPSDGSGSDSKEYNKTGTLQFSAGADGGTVAWNLEHISADSGATGITFSVNSAGTLLILQDQGGTTPVQIAQVTLDAVTGKYVYTQTANLLHAAGGDENEASFTLGFTVTDGDGDKADGKLTLLIDDDTPSLVSAPTTGLSLNEDDLVLGNDEVAPKEALSATGSLHISLGADGGSVALSATGATWDDEDATLTANDGSWMITLNTDGTYKFDLLDNTLAHGIADNGQNTFGVDVTYTATDGDKDVLSGSFKIEIVDDVPVATGEQKTVREADPASGDNLVLAFDVSGSMSDRVAGPGSDSRLQVAKDAAINLINATNAGLVLIVTFAGSASASQWMTKEDALDFIQNNIPNPNGSTDYDDVIDAISDVTPPSAPTSVYFFSDGAVGGNDDLNNQERQEWEQYLAQNGMKSYAVGVGSDISAQDEDLKDVAWPGEPIVITSPTDPILLATVVAPVPTSASGNVLENDSFGADGGRIQSITVGGVTFTWDGAETITKSGSETGTISGFALNIASPLGGSFTFDFKTGAWTYAAPAQLVVNSSETFTYVLVDGDGDTTPASLTINLEAVNDAPVNTVPSSLTAAEDTELAITGLSVGDVDANGGSLTVKLEVEDGKLTLTNSNGLTVSGNNSDTVTLTGSVSAINAALAGLKYKGDLNFNGADQLKITTTDNGNTGIGGAKTDTDTVAITVTPVNDAPILSPETRTIEFTEDGSGKYLFNGVNVSDVDNPTNFAGGSIEISLGDSAVAGDQIFGDSDVRMSGGNVQIWSGGIFTGNWVTIGTLASGGFGQTSIKIDLTSGATEGRVEFFLESIAYKSTSDNPTDADRTVTVTFSDGGNTGAGGSLTDISTITVTVNPVNDAPAASGDRIITNAGVGSQFSVANWALLHNDTDIDSDDLSVTSIGNRIGLDAWSGTDGVTVVDTGWEDGWFTYRASDGDKQSDSVWVEVQQDTSGALDGGSGNDILVGVAKPVGQVTTIKFANSYDVGDVVKITLDGMTFSHTVAAGSTSANSVYSALLASVAVVGGQTLQQLLDEKGIDDSWSSSKLTATWSGEHGAENAFDVVATVDNSNDVGTKWHYEVDFSNSISWFEPSGTIKIKIGSDWYSENANNAGVANDSQRFDKTAEALAADLRDQGFDVTYNTSTNNFLIKTTGATTVDGEYRPKPNQNWQDANANLVQTGTAPSNQATPLVDTDQDASDGGITMNGLGGDDILIGSDAGDILNGGNGADILFGGLGLDTMTGGTGADTFVFDETAFDEIDVTDVITDYNLAQGDMLDVSALLDSLLGESATKDQRLDVIDVRNDGANTFVSIDTDQGAKDIAMLNGVHDVKILFDDKHASTIVHD